MAYASTIHSAQGSTRPLVLANIGNVDFTPGLSYVAISRVCRSEHLALTGTVTAARFRQNNVAALVRVRFEQYVQQLYEQLYVNNPEFQIDENPPPNRDLL